MSEQFFISQFNFSTSQLNHVHPCKCANEKDHEVPFASNMHIFIHNLS